MAKRFFIVLILLSIIAIAPSIFASERVFLISENKVTIFDWSTRKASRVIRVKGEALAVVEGQDPNFAFVLSRGRVNDHLPTGPSYISYIDLRKGRVQKNMQLALASRIIITMKRKINYFCSQAPSAPFQIPVPS